MDTVTAITRTRFVLAFNPKSARFISGVSNGQNFYPTKPAHPIVSTANVKRTYNQPSFADIYEHSNSCPGGAIG